MHDRKNWYTRARPLNLLTPRTGATSDMRRKVRYLTFWITMALWFGQGGCTPPLNEANFGLPALKAPVSTDFSGAPSLDQGFDRSQWESVTVELPAKMVDTRPAYWEPLTIKSGDPSRSSGNYPIAATALDLAQDTGDLRAQAAEIVLDPFYQLMWMFAIPVRAGITEQPWHLKHGPRRSYDLVPSDPASVVLFPDAATPDEPAEEVEDIDQAYEPTSGVTELP